MKRFLIVLVCFLGFLGIVYVSGPRVALPELNPELPKVPSNLIQLKREIDLAESALTNLKPDNEARIIWYDSIPKKTAYSIVYLHGWSASQEEGDPVHLALAKRYGCNLYLPRLAGHGLIEDEPMRSLTADQLYNSAKQALAVGKQLGDKVILMGTSTGGTLALELAENNPDLAGLILYSPNVEIFDSNASLLSKRWGLQLARMIKGGDYHESDDRTPEKDQYWTTRYRLEALTQLQALMDATMEEETFEKVKQPLFLGYYYKDAVHQDSTVSVQAMLDMYANLSTPENKKMKVAFPNVGGHVIASHLTSNDLESVKMETFHFVEQVLGIRPKKH